MDGMNVASFPAPWDLQGKGYILLYKFKKDFVEKEGNVPDFLQGHFKGGFGAVMLVDYAKSNAGPYGEFLFIPGKFDYEGKKLDTISKIYVSSMESVVNGRKNWGIPKEQADFKFEQIDKRTEKVSISKDGVTFAEFELKSGKIFFHVSTKLLPFPLVQKYEGKFLFTNFFGKGRGRFAKVKKISINKEYFPDIASYKPIAVVAVSPFDITFPVAEM